MISVVVTTFDRAELLPDCLDDLLAQTLPADRFEVIFVANGCTDDTESVLASRTDPLPHVRWISLTQPGRSAALNAGIEAARGSHVAFLDDDVRPGPQWLERIVTAFETVRPRPVWLGGRVEPAFDCEPPAWLDPGDEHVTFGRVACFRENRLGYPGCNWAAERDVLLEVGGFSPAFGPVGRRFRVGEDLELGARLFARHPQSWYDPDIVVRHRIPQRKLSVRYRLWRAYLNGLVFSRLAAAGYIRPRRHAPPVGTRRTTGFRAPDAASQRKHRLVKAGERLARRVGRVVGALRPRPSARV